MNDIKITDLFGINIMINDNFNKDYIIINFSNEYIDDLLIPINQYNGTYIYKLNKSNKFFKKVNNKININIDNYVELGNYILYDINDIKIILAHKNACIITNKYTLLDVIGNLHIWKPISSNKEYTNLGVICTNNNYFPNEEIGLIHSSHIKIYDDYNVSLFQNDFNILGSKKNGHKKLLTYNILKSTDDNKENINDNKENINDNNKIIEHFSKDISDKHLVLVESDDPWFINKNDTIQLKYINNENYFGHRKLYHKGALFKSNMILDESSPSLGFGYSYAERRNVIKEIFSNINDSSNYIILTMFIIITSLFLYNIYIKKYTKNK
jgi:hypothetical protein